MSNEIPPPGAEGTRGIYTGAEPNPVIEFLKKPRILLLILAAWSVLSVLAETFTSNGLFLENHNPGEFEMDGALGGLALAWQGIPLAVLYVYCFRDPQRFHGIYWLALVHMGSICASQLYHWLVTDDYTFESIAVPLGVSGAIGALVFAHLFTRKEPEAELVRSNN
jgi:hypothetical protein